MARLDMDVDVVIVGGGISGLTAAYHLHKRDPKLSICVLEAKDRVGGRTLTLPLKGKHGTDYWDLGGQWVSTSQKHVMALLEELGLETYPQYTTGSKVMQIESAEVKGYKSDIPALSVLALIDLQLFIMKVDRLRKKIDCRDPYNCDDAGEKWDTKTLETFLRESLWTEGAYQSIAVAIRATATVEPSQTSVLYFLNLVASAGGLMPLVEAKEWDAQGLKVKGGTQQISRLLAEQVGMEKVLLDHAVDTVKQNDKFVKVTCRNGLTVTCQHVIIAAPPMATSKIQFVPQFSLERREIEKWMSFGNYIKVIVTYDHVVNSAGGLLVPEVDNSLVVGFVLDMTFWRSSGKSGEAVTYGGLSDVSGCDVGPLCVVFDATSPKGSPALVTFLAGDQAIRWSKQDANTRKKAVLKSLAEFFGPEAVNCLDYYERDWSEESYIEGAVAAVGPGAMRNFVVGLREPQGRLHFAGAESATEWHGYMSGAVQAGIRAGTEVLYNVRPGSVSKEELSGTVYSPSYHTPVTMRKSQKKSYFTYMMTFALLLGIVAVMYQFYRK